MVDVVDSGEGEEACQGVAVEEDHEVVLLSQEEEAGEDQGVVVHEKGRIGKSWFSQGRHRASSS